MTHKKQAIVVGLAVLATSMAALAQQNQQNPQRRQAIAAAVEALGLTQDQVAQIREIRRERPQEGTQGPELRSWRQGQSAKLQKILTEDQKTKLAEIKAAGPDTPTYAGAVMLGLAQRQGQNRPRGAGRPAGGTGGPPGGGPARR